MIDPQDGWGGWMPSPRNDNPASNRIISPNSLVATTISGPAMFGRICRHRMRRDPAPAISAARI